MKNMNQMMKQMKKMQAQMAKAQEELGNIEMLQDMVIAAVNDAMKQADELAAKDLGKLTGGLNLPGMF
jgi:DNA-binding protein YbaB